MNGHRRRSTRTSRPRLRVCASRSMAAANSAPGLPLKKDSHCFGPYMAPRPLSRQEADAEAIGGLAPGRRFGYTPGLEIRPERQVS